MIIINWSLWDTADRNRTESKFILFVAVKVQLPSPLTPWDSHMVYWGVCLENRDALYYIVFSHLFLSFPSWWSDQGSMEPPAMMILGNCEVQFDWMYRYSQSRQKIKRSNAFICLQSYQSGNVCSSNREAAQCSPNINKYSSKKDFKTHK